MAKPRGDTSRRDPEGSALRGGEPYLSVVAASRNDDHGGDLTRRMQVFVDGLAAQARRHRLPCELILVEWNPPPDRPPLRDALRWPDDGGLCPVRIVTVPAALHRRHAHADRLPLFQMIAKNAGIRRARAPFVLASNVDVLFSDPLFAWLARRPLEAGCVYRADRIDVDRGVPDGDVAERLAWCESHVLRANRASGLFLAPRDGRSHRVGEATLTPGQAAHRAGARMAQLAGGPPASWPHRASASFQRTRLGMALEASPAWPVLRAPWRAFVLLPDRVIHLALDGARRLSGLPSRPPLLGPGARDRLDELLLPWRPLPDLHTLACGDFLLMARGDWDALHGHPELEAYSFHLDSLALCAAHARGIREVRLPQDHVLYHMEHGAGWTPDGDAALYARMRALGIPILTYGSLAARVRALQREPDPTCAGPDWGLARESLPEETVCPARQGERSDARRHAG
jgi:hypothetical protein